MVLLEKAMLEVHELQGDLSRKIFWFDMGFVKFVKFDSLAYQGKDIVFRFIIEYSSLRDFGAYVIIVLFLYEDF
jgi:hypothetical protein